MHPTNAEIEILLSVGRLVVAAIFSGALWKIATVLHKWHKAFILFIEDHNMLVRDYYERYPEREPGRARTHSAIAGGD